MLYKSLAFLILTSLSCGFIKKENNCDRFKTGSFLYHYRGDQGDFFFLIERNDSMQTETNEKTGDVSRLRIKWTSDCSYELFFISSTYNLPDSIIRLKKLHPLKTTMTSTTNDYYLFESKKDDNSFVLKDTLWIKK